MSTSTDLRVLTFNCWGLKYVAKHRAQRIRAIAAALGNDNYHIIALQELWVHADYEYLRLKLSKSLPYGKYFYSGAFGSGLAIFSKFPIQSTYIHPYALNGSPLDVIGGDWFVGKAAAGVLLSHPSLGTLEVINTHFHAQGGEDGPEYLRAHRLSNAWEFSKLIARGAQQGHYVLGMGDLNSTPHSLPINLVFHHSGAKDAWLFTHPSSSALSNPPSSPVQALRERGVTCDSPLNSYTQGKPLGGYARSFFGKRLDYILFRGPSGTGPLYSFDCMSSEVRLHEKVPHCDISLSDHFAVDAVFKIEPNNEFADRPSLSRFSEVHQRGIISTIEESLRALTDCYRESRARSRSFMTIFYVSIIALCAIVVGSVWFPKSWINPVFLIFSILISWLATTLFYVGFVFGRWERNALTNVIEELEVRKTRLLLGTASPQVN